MAIGEGWNLNQPVNNFVLHPLGSLSAVKLTSTGPRLHRTPPYFIYFRSVLTIVETGTTILGHHWVGGRNLTFRENDLNQFSLKALPFPSR